MFFKKLIDLTALFFCYPTRAGIFLRDQYDAFWPFLSLLAKAYRRVIIPKKKFIVVVGSLGKTTTKEALRRVFLKKNRFQSWSNYGSCLAENILRSSLFERYDVFEVGIDRLNEMDLYAPVLKPDIVVVTSVKSEHNRTFTTFEMTREEKVKMVRTLSHQGLAVLNGDDPNVGWMATQTKARVVTFGFDNDNDVCAKNIRSKGLDGQEFDLILDGKTHHCTTKLLAEHQIYSLLAAVACARSEGLSLENVLNQLKEFRPYPQRMEPIRLKEGAVIIDNTYKSATEAYELNLEYFSSIHAKRKIAILGDVHEPMEKKRELYRKLGKRFAHIADYFIFIGDDTLRTFKSSVNKNTKKGAITHYCGTNLHNYLERIGQLKPFKEGDLILIIGPGTRNLRRITLWIKGEHVECAAKFCWVKLEKCDACPLLSRDVKQIKNTFIKKKMRL